MIRQLAGQLNLYSPGGNIKNPSGFGNLGDLIGALLQAAIIIAGLGALALVIMGGVQYITSGGDKAGTESARDKITHAILGLFIVVAAYALTRIIETIFGVRIVSGINWPSP